MLLPSRRQSGQALLIILLLLAVVLTVSLSIVSRSITEVGISTYEDESVRALNAAEAGIETTILDLKNITPGTINDITFDNQSSYRSQLLLDTATDNEYAFPTSLKSGESAFFWLVSHDENGDLSCGNSSGINLPCSTTNRFRICFGNAGTVGNNNADAPAIEVSVFYDRNASNSSQNVVDAGDYSGVRVSTKYFDPNPARISSGGTNAAEASSVSSCTFGGINNAFRATTPFVGTPDISVTNALPQANDPYTLYVPCRQTEGCMLGLSVKMLYSPTHHTVGVGTMIGGSQDMPAQGYLISSTGFSGDSVRKIEAHQTFPLPPEFATGALFVQGGILK